MRRLRPKHIMDMFGWSRSKLYKDIAAGKFPAPLKDGPMSYWTEDEAEREFNARAAAAKAERKIRMARAAEQLRAEIASRGINRWDKGDSGVRT